MNIRNHIRQAIVDGLDAHVTQRYGQAGAIFHDENEFIPFDDLNFNSEYGYFRISLLPDIERDCTNENPDTLHLGKDYSEDWKPLIWADGGGNLAMIGDPWNAADLYQALHAYLFGGSLDAEKISENDPAWDYMKRIDWAIDEYREYIPGAKRRTRDRVGNTIRAAATRGAIRGAVQDDIGNWKFRPATFRGWLVKTARETRGRKQQIQ